jgi:microcystin-dependent protein
LYSTSRYFSIKKLELLTNEINKNDFIMAYESFIASIMPVGFNFEPRGWALCNGQIISIAQNTALFSLLGTTYGGNGTTTFALPDLRGRFAIGTGQGTGLSPNSLGETGGSENVDLTIAQMPAHAHAFTVAANSFDGEVSNPTQGSISSKNNGFSPTANGSLGGINVSPQGSGQPFSIRNPYLGVNFCIAMQGIFPPRS